MKALYPGSFDPVTAGHLDVIERASRLFESLVIGIFFNPDKESGAFAKEERLELLKAAAGHLPNVTFRLFSGLAVDGAKDCSADVIVRGIRNAGDMESELQMARLNAALAGVETLLLPASPNVSHISSSMVRQIGHYGGDLSGLVPEPICARVQSALRKN